LLLAEFFFRPEVFRSSLANMHYNGGRFDKAADLYSKNGEDSKANLGKSLYKSRKPDEAAGVMDEALAAEPEDAGILYDRGNASFSARDYASAIDYYTRSLLVDPNDKDAKANLELAIRKQQQNPPPPKKEEKDSGDQQRSEEEVRNILEALDNKEAQDRKEQQKRPPQRSDNWW
ncbi:MAG TPA: tetratricopeptide repeat protein, partial [Candidatus Cloacimonadota bacterium]|nr:tetratricopeptide repeat protein [Candidatus Cloacimonadota bacterium]